ncbi:MAG TPA: glutathione S-transferase family protein [Polyangiaceae bacterium]
MGKLVDGQWTTQWYEPDAKGRFVREQTKFSDRVTRDGSSGFPAESGRYHLYVSLACPWAHRTILMRKLKGLEDAVSLDVVHPHMGENGWEFREFRGATPDSVNGFSYLHQVYTRAKPDYTGRVTVPVLWDKRRQTIVCNDSRSVMRMLDHEFVEFATRSVDLCPPELQTSVDAEIDALYAPVNDGVYRAGFASSQEAYEEAARKLFEALDRYEERLSSSRFLLGPQLTEADLCFFTTLYRFDPIYHYHFKCNLRKVADYTHISGFLRDVYQTPHVADTCDIEHAKHHYFTSHPQLNPKRIVPVGPETTWDAPHDRHRL